MDIEQYYLKRVILQTKNYMGMKGISFGRIAVIAFMFVFSSFIVFPVHALSRTPTETETYRVKEEFRIKRTSDGTVSLYNEAAEGDRKEFTFTKFNADVLLLIYRRIDTANIIKSMAKKYTMSKTDARRAVKVAINELKQWDLIVMN